MSSILKALRKLEEEKAAMGEGGVDIARDILKRSGVPQTPNTVWPILCLVLALLLVAGAAGVVILSNRAEPTTVLAPAPVVVPKFDPKPLKDLAVQTSTQPTPVVSKNPLQDTAISEPVKSEPVKSESLTGLQHSVPLPKSRAQAVATRANGLPFLKLTAIAFRANPAERIAILNDLPVMQGTSIEGAEVVEILSDRVILRWQGEQFEQQLEED